ncbi:MAG: TetR/AcrR family transcriptional regulator [Bacteroidota bacterium]
MKLKERILIKAVELFNEKGISATSPNQIAAALNISSGNLTYHFKTKATLIKEVYERMDEESRDFIKMDGYLTLNDFRITMQGFRDFMEKYRFFFHDLVFILRNYPEVGELYVASNLKRFEQGRELFEYFVETGRMVPEEGGINYDFLTYNIWMVGAFWNIQSKVISPTSIFDQHKDMLDMTWYMIIPYLTEKGKEEYDQINAFLEKEIDG